MLKTYVKEKLESLTGHVGVYYKNLETGEVFFLENATKGKDEFLAASVIKIWIMAEAFHQIEQGILRKQSTVKLLDSDKVPSGETTNYSEQRLKGNLSDDMFPESGILNYMHSGLEITVEDLYKLMIIVSDNTATNMLIRILGMDKINQFIKSCGMEKTKLNRLLFDTNISTCENIISLEETGTFLEQIYKNQLVSAKASQEMSAILQNQQTTYKIPFFLRNIPIAHKTGEDNGIANDVGIIYSDIPFILCFAANNTDVPQAERACQDIAREAYNYTTAM